MINQSGIDDQTAAFVRQTEERWKIQLNLLSEKARVANDGPDAIKFTLDERIAALKKQRETDRSFDNAPIGIGRIFPDPRDITPPYGTPAIGTRPAMICTLNQRLELDQATYVVLLTNAEYDERSDIPKSAYGTAAANPLHWDTLGIAHIGYKTDVDVPAAQGDTTVRIRSVLATRFSWVEANAVNPSWNSQVSAAAHMWLTFDGQFVTAPPQALVNFIAANGQVLSHNDMDTTTPGAVIEAQISVPPGSGTTINIFETIELVALTPNGHAYIGGHYTWQPLNVHLQEGCRRIEIPSIGYWGEF